MLSSELPGPDSDPVRVLLLGEKLIAFRDTNGKVGLLQNNCPHRGASLFFGRNEEAGMRCVYHGWKFDVDGNCIDMPNEPAESDFKAKVKAVAYPCQERGGHRLDLHGPAHRARRRCPTSKPTCSKAPRRPRSSSTCNWLQILEGDIDTTHVGFLHYGGLKAEEQPRARFSEYQLRQKPAHFQVIDTPGGVAYGARRPGPPGEYYWRIAQFCLPFYTFTPPGRAGRQEEQRRARADGRPPHDELLHERGRSAPGQRRHRPGGLPRPACPNTTDWYGRSRFAPELDQRLLHRSRDAAQQHTAAAAIRASPAC